MLRQNKLIYYDILLSIKTYVYTVCFNSYIYLLQNCDFLKLYIKMLMATVINFHTTIFKYQNIY